MRVINSLPSAAKWNQLGENDAGFKDGTNIDSDVITPDKLNANVAFFAYLSSNQAIGATTNIKVNFDTEDFDVGSNFDNSSSYQFVAPADGLYFFSAGTVIIGLNNETEVRFMVNNAEFVRADRSDADPNSSNPDHGSSASVILNLSQNDTVHINARNGDGTSRAISGSSVRPTFFCGYRID